MKSLVKLGAAELGYLSLKDGRGYLFSLASRRTASASLALYNAQSRTAKLAKSALAQAFRLGVTPPFLPRVMLSGSRDFADGTSPLLQGHLRRLFPVGPLAYAVSLGTPGPHRKPVLQVMTRDGEILGYVKVGWNAPSVELVRREAEVLEELAQAHQSSFTIPRVLYRGDCGDRFVCIQSAPLGPGQPVPAELDVANLRVLGELALYRPRWLTLGESRFWQDALEVVRQLRPGYHRGLLSRATAAVQAHLGHRRLPYQFGHGDFAPWNMKTIGGRPYVFDWEYARPETSPGSDLFHFLIQSTMLLKKWDAGRIFQSIDEGGSSWRAVEQHLRGIGLSAELIKPLLLVYLIDRLFSGIREPERDRELAGQLGALINLLTIAGY